MGLAVHYLHPPLSEDVRDYLQARLHPGVQLTVGVEPPEPATYRILIAGRPSREHLSASPELQAVVVPWAGIPESTRQLMAEFPRLALHNLHHNAGPVAEHTVALLLAAAKFIVPMDRSMRAGDWTPRYRSSPSVMLEGKTALVLGYGAIGQKVASLCQGLGMDVIAVRRAAEADSPASVCCAPIESLPQLLPQAAALLVCLPQTSETTGLIGQEELSRLPPDAILVNIGRGPVVDEAALYNALRDGTLYAAGVDVWYNYPTDESERSNTPPSVYPFHELPNVVLSPHRAGSSRDTETLRMAHLAELLNAAARGEPMPNRVDLEQGY